MTATHCLAQCAVPTATADAKPRSFTFPLPKTALLVLKMQREFLDEGGFGSLLGNDVSAVRGVVPLVKTLIEAARKAGLEVIHTKEGHKPDLSDVAASKLIRTRERSTNGITIGNEGPLGRVLVLGEPGNAIVEDCKPADGEKVFVTPAKSVLFNSGLHEYLLKEDITHLILAGVTTEIGVQLVMRELNDRGFQPCLVEDCTASYNDHYKEVSLDMIIAQGGIIGWTSTNEAILAALMSPTPEKLPERPSWISSDVPTVLKADRFSELVQVSAAMDSSAVTIADAKPSPFTFPLGRTACIVIDMQRDFILEGGFGSTLGNNVKLLQSIVPTVAWLLQICREYGIHLVHTLEAHLPDLSDCPSAKLTRGQLPAGLRIGDSGDMGRILVQREWGNEILNDNAPLPSEKAMFKPGKGAFFGTDLHHFLREKGVTHLLFAGVTTEVCVQTSMREANDRGYHCLMVEDCTESYFPQFKAATIQMLTDQGAIVGWSSTCEQLQKALAVAQPGVASAPLPTLSGDFEAPPAPTGRGAAVHIPRSAPSTTTMPESSQGEAVQAEQEMPAAIRMAIEQKAAATAAGPDAEVRDPSFLAWEQQPKVIGQEKLPSVSERSQSGAFTDVPLGDKPAADAPEKTPSACNCTML
eukprot:SM000009S23588  [mRNA]  locus=s9:954270:958815:+ [translate_table: standard]